MEVVSTSTGHRVACLDVEVWLKDDQATVVHVTEFKCQRRFRLLVAVNSLADQGLVLLFDVATSMVVKTIEIPQQVCPKDFL